MTQTDLFQLCLSGVFALVVTFAVANGLGYRRGYQDGEKHGMELGSIEGESRGRSLARAEFEQRSESDELREAKAEGRRSALGEVIEIVQKKYESEYDG
jgi:predicted transposase YdaD